MVRVVPPTVKSLLVAGSTAAAATVRVTAWLDGPLRVAVTVFALSSPDSSMDVGSSTRDAVGVPSSSVTVSVDGRGSFVLVIGAGGADRVGDARGAGISPRCRCRR